MAADRGLRGYGHMLARALVDVTVALKGRTVRSAEGIEAVVAQLRTATRDGGTIFFVGNGGSAAIASHCAADYLKNGGFRTSSLHDPAVLTCLANDLGYEQVFAEQIRRRASRADVLLVISSSGRSPNILNAARAARELSMYTIALSGFDAGNPLRAFGDVDFHVPSRSYGMVEIAHLAICHAILDRASGMW